MCVLTSVACVCVCVRGRFVMLTTSTLYEDFSVDSTKNASVIYARVAPTPSGPFSAPFPVRSAVLDPNQSWYCPYLHPALDKDDGKVFAFTHSVAVGWGVNPLVAVELEEVSALHAEHMCSQYSVGA